MPRGDGTGPRGMGPMAGHAGGYCGGFGGGGRGWRNRFHATGLPGWARAGFAASFRNPAPEEEKQALKLRADALQSELDAVKKRLETIGTDAEK